MFRIFVIFLFMRRRTPFVSMLTHSVRAPSGRPRNYFQRFCSIPATAITNITTRLNLLSEQYSENELEINSGRIMAQYIQGYLRIYLCLYSPNIFGVIIYICLIIFIKYVWQFSPCTFSKNYHVCLFNFINYVWLFLSSIYDNFIQTYLVESSMNVWRKPLYIYELSFYTALRRRTLSVGMLTHSESSFQSLGIKFWYISKIWKS